MNKEQIPKYRAEWGKAVKTLLSQGRTRAEIEGLRQKIHLKIGAYWVVNGVVKVKSSTRLTNKEFDDFLRETAAIYAGGDLESQLEQLNMPEKRILHACARLFDSIGIGEDGRARYAEGIVKKPLMDCDANDERRIIIALTHTAQHKTGVNHNHPRSGQGRERFDHRVGSKSNKTNPPENETSNRIQQPQEEDLEEAPF